MTIAQAYDVAYVRFTVPDVDVMRRFLNDFGMIEAETANPDVLYMRGAGRAPYLHVSEKGETAGFKALGIWVEDRAALERLAAHDGSKVEELDGPGGGLVVRLRDPDGHLIEAIAEQELRTVAPYEPKGEPWNIEGEHPRIARFRRVPKGASHVQRLGHCVLAVTNFRNSEAWYKERFGFVTSDEIQPVPEVAIGAFMRCDRGDEPCDHHTIFLFEHPSGKPHFMHSAFEVANLDDLMAGHDFLRDKGYQTKWGIGRHILGSQVFDYWLDPYGHEIEHWTDGDQLRTADGGGIGSIDELLGVQWGPEMPNRPKVG